MHRRTGQFFTRGAEPSLPEKFFDSARKTAMLTCKITLPDSPHPITISKNPDFGYFISIDRMNSVFFRLMNTKIFFSFLAAGLCPKKIAFARKIMGLPESGGLQPPAPWLVRL